MTTKKNIGVFTGTYDSSMLSLTDATLASELQDDGVGLYGHGNGIYWMVAYGHMSSLMSEWYNSTAASGVAEFGMSFGYADGTITVKNTGTTDEIIKIGDTFTGSNGTYQVLADPGQPGSEVTGTANKNGYVADDDMGYYVIKAGSSLTLDVEATTLGTADNDTSTDSITSYNGSASNISITSSSAFSGGESESSIISYFTGGTSAPMYYLYQKYDYKPLQGNVNIGGEYFSNNDLSSWKTYVNAARADGVLNIAPITSYNGLDTNYIEDFATSNYWAATREAALYGGGISFDMPPGFALHFTTAWYPIFSESANTYINFIESQIKWATSEGLRSSVIISPQSNDSSNGGLLAETQALVARFKADGVMPSQFIVENYGNVTSDEYSTDTNSLQAVSEWLSSQNLTVATNSESNQETEGSAVSQVDDIMTGIKNSASITYGTTATLYDSPALYATSSSTVITVNISTNINGLELSSTLGTLSDNNQLITYTGTETEVTNLLKNLKITDNVQTLSSGTGTVSLKFIDSAGEIDGTTSISYTGLDNQTMNLSKGEIESLNASSGTLLAIASDSSLTLSGGASLIADGIFDNITITDAGSDSAIAIALTGTGVLSNVKNTSGITLENNSSLTLSDSDAYLTSYNGNLYKSSDSSLNLVGTINDLTISGANNTIAIGLNGNGNISDASGNIGITLNESSSLLTVTDSVIYTTINQGTLNTGDNAYINLSVSDNGYINDNGGTVVYQPTGDNATFHIGAGTAKIDMTSGYTAVFQDMSTYSQSFISDFNGNYGEVLATDLQSLNDLRIYYGDGNAYIQEDNEAGFISISNVGVGGISLFTDLNGTNFTQQEGSKSILIDRTETNNIVDITSGTQTYNANGQVFHVNGGNSTINMGATNTTLDVDMTSNAIVKLTGVTSSNLTLILTDMSASNLSRVYANGETTLSNSSNGSEIILSGNYSLGGTSNTLSNGANIFDLTGKDGIALVLNKN